MLNKLKQHYIDLGVFLFALLFSTWLMFATFGYRNGDMLIGARLWSDFSSTIPLIRSFSFGYNFPPQYPLYANAPMRFHFLFYVLVGFLERAGVRLDYALNIPSVIGFVALIFLIYWIAKFIFSSKKVGVLSVIFFLFNGTFSFVYFFQNHPLSSKTIMDIISNNTFPSFGPYDNKLVSAFWNLNIYTNQRHFALALAFSFLLLFYILYAGKRNFPFSLKRSMVIGILLGLSFFLHTAIFVMTMIVLFLLCLGFLEIRRQGLVILIVAGIIFLPQYLYSQSGGSMFKTTFHPGYLITNLTIASFFTYWVYNLGFHIILIPLGFIKSSHYAKKIFLAFFSLFIIGNLFQFSPEIAANHKFFNMFMIIGIMFSAYTIVLLWSKNIALKALAIVFFVLLTLSGIIDFFPVYNDYAIPFTDYPHNTDIAWVMQHTPPNSIMLNSNYLYDTASIAGRKIFMGWPYFAWSAGYDTGARGNALQFMLTTTDKAQLCHLLKQNNIDYVEISLPPDKNITDSVSPIFEEQFKPAYTNAAKTYSVYPVKQNCILNI